jgi:hypothetical protein
VSHLPAIPPQGPQAARCAEHGALDCPCTDAPVFAPAGPVLPAKVIASYDAPDGPRGERRTRETRLVAMSATALEALVRSFREDRDEDYLGLRVEDARGETWVVERGALVLDVPGEPTGGACECGRGDCFMCGDDRGRAA